MTQREPLRVIYTFVARRTISCIPEARCIAKSRESHSLYGPGDFKYNAAWVIPFIVCDNPLLRLGR